MNLRLESLSFQYPASREKDARAAPAAVDGIELTVNDGEFFSLLGPSGCGKTTLLWLVAGFHTPAAGSIRFDRADVTHLPPEKRNVGMVFQNYALFPHLTVEDNVGFGLTARGEPRDIARGRVHEMLTLVDLPPDQYAHRRPAELSGGQQQRIALARALAPRPNLLLLDEPLSNLDAALRVTTRGRIKDLQKRLGLTTLYVTHDQEEAMALSDRMAILQHGRVLQVGTPAQLYSAPDHPFVAQFLGRCNLLKARLTSRPGWVDLGGRDAGPIAASDQAPSAGGADVLVLARPETGRIVIGRDAPLMTSAERTREGEIEFGAQFLRMEFLGPRRVFYFDAPNLCAKPIEVEIPADDQPPLFATGHP
ncbi:MAG TPA: ABC transporter ATP-binding protein, partial [Planctomycetota bacterium]|nr:ABC transporter ATP-binding protein [Planctomycetota bacterium]